MWESYAHGNQVNCRENKSLLEESVPLRFGIYCEPSFLFDFSADINASRAGSTPIRLRASRK